MENIYKNKICEICGKPANKFVFGCFLCDNIECIEKAQILRGGPAGHKLKVINVGSENPIKIKAVEEVINNLIGKILIKGIDINSKVSPHPIGLEETTKGAINRAKGAYEHSSCIYGIGIEAGLIKINNKYLDIHICAVYDGFDYSIGTSRGFELPMEIVNKIKNSVECSLAVKELYGLENIGQKEGIIGYLTNGSLNRIDLCKDAVLCALIPKIKKYK